MLPRALLPRPPSAALARPSRAPPGRRPDPVVGGRKGDRSSVVLSKVTTTPSAPSGGAFRRRSRRLPLPPPRASSSSGASPRLGFNLEDIATPFVGATTTLNEGIAAFYDQSSGLWEAQWGEHMHHGYYPDGADREDHAQAQVDMIDNALEWAGVDLDRVEAPFAVADVGCGIGGSARHIARRAMGESRRKAVRVEGVTLSPVQADRATALTRDAGLASSVSFRVGDALASPFGDATFDLVWSMESGEHMPDKRRFVDELARMCKPGGTIVLVTWCRRELEEGESRLPDAEQFLLDRICDAYYLPEWCSVGDYARLAAEAGLESIATADWSEEVRPFWKAVVKMALTPAGAWGLLRAGPATLRGGLVMPLMQKGLRDGTIKFNLMTAVKPKV